MDGVSLSYTRKASAISGRLRVHADLARQLINHCLTVY